MTYSDQAIQTFNLETNEEVAFRDTMTQSIPIVTSSTLGVGMNNGEITPSEKSLRPKEYTPCKIEELDKLKVSNSLLEQEVVRLKNELTMSNKQIEQYSLIAKKAKK